MAEWSAVHGDVLFDGRLIDMVGHGGNETVSRVMAMASAFSPLLDTLYEFDMMATSPFFAGSVPPDPDPSDNASYPWVLRDAQDPDSDLDDEPWGAPPLECTGRAKS